MNFKPKSLVLLLVVSSFVYGQQTPFINSPDPNKQWELQSNLSDEFNSSTIDWANKWNYANNLPIVNAWKWNNNSNVKIVNNAAEIKMSHNTNNVPVDGTYFNSGILKSKSTFTTGFVEVKMKGAVINIPGADNGRGVCPSFWLYSDFNDAAAEGKTVYSEIDVVELQQFDYFNGEQDDIFDMDLNLHLVLKEGGKRVWYRPKQNVATQKNHYTASFNPTLGYHVYGCEVTDTEITWYVDGKKVATKPNTHWNLPMYVTVSLGLRVPFVTFLDNKFEPINPVTDARAKKQLPAIPTSMSVDYIRVWKRATTSSVNSNTTSTTSTGYNGSIRVFLDQSKDNMNIILDNFSGQSQIKLFDMSGNQLLNTTSNLSTIVLSTSAYPDGAYIINVINSNGTYSQKIFIK
ncbi:family 16 glycosylhydrolase [Flavobacterium sp. NG2]|uniref:family 16 glycosylhydrolase n=1 Tax=Flavobacterium sp. NG2 TaxID=3097547 RepID=UPI002A83BA96|nr:family 16 glycosylhydrolase [Flavobacterium sp. NG2]WPR72235.1 family 16 glycosylhydrolase [Flavobacterium sp. NG2]